ncbi:MAG: glycosyltransferase, partial [Patescibacteria group bacterium]
FFPKSRLAVLGNPLPAGLKIASAKIATDRFVMAYVGQLEPYKGVIDLIKITQGLSGDWELLIAGDGSAKREAVKWSLDNGKIKLLGRLNAIELEQQIWSRADILINPSKTAESFGLVIIESYARGIPVLASSIGALKELVKDRQTGWLFKAGDQLDLKRNIEFILANRDQLAPMKDNCLAVAKKFQLDGYLTGLLKL